MQADALLQPLVCRGTGIHSIPAGEKKAEALSLEGGALIAHLHAFLNIHSATAIHAQEHIAELCPGEYHQVQIGTLHGQHRTQLSGTEALRHNGGIIPNGQPVAQKQKPEQQRRSDTDCNQFGNILHGGQVHPGLGEHLLGSVQIHGQRLMILQGSPASAGDIAAGDGIGQIFFDVGLMIAADKAGVLGGGTGQIDGKLKLLDGISKTGQHGQLQPHPLLCGILRSGGKGTHGGADRVAYGEREVTGHTAQGFGEIDQTGLLCFFRKHRFPV